MDRREGETGWVAVVGLIMFVVVIVSSCQAYYDCIDDGLPYYQCGHYARVGR